MRRVEAIAGLRLADIAEALGEPIPDERVRAKGWAGQLLEIALGASAGSLAEPDFQLIGVELKTLPIDARKRPAESTYVCTIDLDPAQAPTWETSVLRRKLARVLWLPLDGARDRHPGERRVGMGALWSPSAAQEQALRADWEEFMDRICFGETNAITAHDGQWLQVRPKAANAAARRTGFDELGVRRPMLPRGFYLRTRFTEQVITQIFNV